jgi:CRP-like cAMP-binding protein
MEEVLAQHHFTAVEIDEIISNALVVKCSKKTVLLREGEIPRFMYWVTKGIFRAGYTDKKGDEITRAFYSPETYPIAVAYGNYITQTPSLSFIESLEDGELLSWHFEYLKKLEETNIKWLRFVKKNLDKTLVLVDIKEWQRYTLTPEEDYQAFLDAMPTLARRIPQHYIASYLGITAEALSRIKSRASKQKNKKKSIT